MLTRDAYELDYPLWPSREDEPDTPTPVVPQVPNGNAQGAVYGWSFNGIPVTNC